MFVCAVGEERAVDAVDALGNNDSSAPERKNGAADEHAGGAGHDADGIEDEASSIRF